MPVDVREFRQRLMDEWRNPNLTPGMDVLLRQAEALADEVERLRPTELVRHYQGVVQAAALAGIAVRVVDGLQVDDAGGGNQ